MEADAKPQNRRFVTWLLDYLPPVLTHPSYIIVSFAEIEAAEACKWLRATGFPQYAQMYEGTHFLLPVLE